MKTSRFKVNPDCAACVASFSKVLKKIAVKVETNVPMQLMTVTYDDSKVKPEEIIKRIESIGYTAELDD